MTIEIDDLALSLPITQEGKRFAQEFARQQLTKQKVEQVFLNTLAICAVSNYLEMMGIATELNSGDSWHPWVRMCADVADLEVLGVGKVECRPLRENQRLCFIPPEVWSERIGYVVVEIKNSLEEARLLGFLPSVDREEVAIEGLQPLENLCDRIAELVELRSNVRQEDRTNSNLSLDLPISLGQWLQNIFTEGWQEVESLLMPAQARLALQFRGISNSNSASKSNEPAIRRAKLIDLGIDLAGSSIALVVEIQREIEQQLSILVQVHPVGANTLPPQLELVIREQLLGEEFAKVVARNADNWIQYNFQAEIGEEFYIEVGLGDVKIIEHFQI